MPDEPLYTCIPCGLDWKEGQLGNSPPWDPRDECPFCGAAVKRKDNGDLPLFARPAN